MKKMDIYDVALDKKSSKFPVWQVFNKNDLRDSKNSLPNFIIDDNEEIVIAKQKEVINELQNKIEDLTKNIHSLECMSNSKERAIVALARDKERLVVELKKERRLNSQFQQQLKDEREFYIKEKQIYCQEMNEYKKHKRKLLINHQFEEDNNKLKSKLEEVLQTNYNLCIKFLRMKHTKSNLKQRLDSRQTEHAKILKDLSCKLENARSELDLIISEQFQNPISLNHKKTLEIIKHNNYLINENLSLKLQLEHTNDKVDCLKNKQLKLKYQKMQISSKQNPVKPSNFKDLDIKKKINTEMNFDELSLIKSSTKCSEICSSREFLFDSSTTVYSIGLRTTQSEPQLLDFDNFFKQMKSIATQTT